MAIYLYCLTEPGCVPPSDLRGITGGAVRSLEVGGRVAAWVSDIPGEPGEVRAEQVARHDSVVRAALAHETPLPARFGQSFADDSALCQALEARMESLVRSLERVRGGVEMTVRILLGDGGGAAGPGRSERRREEIREPVPEDAGPGRAYLARVRARREASAELQRQAEFLQARVSRAVDGFAREEVCSPVMPGTRSFSLSHLVARESVEAYRVAVDALVSADPGLRLLVSGPWAPYSFARLAE